MAASSSGPRFDFTTWRRISASRSGDQAGRFNFFLMWPISTAHPERSVDFLDFPELEARMASARVIACHAGPGSIMMARWIGHRPVVVPRLAELGEVVDNHQVTFARQLAAQGEVLLAESEAAFREAMDTALASAGPARSSADPLAMSEPIRRFDELIADLVRTPRARAR